MGRGEVMGLARKGGEGTPKQEVMEKSVTAVLQSNAEPGA